MRLGYFARMRILPLEAEKRGTSIFSSDALRRVNSFLIKISEG
jgi:hypothetical protein